MDIDYTNDIELDVKEIKINFRVLVPLDHKFIKQFNTYFDFINDGKFKIHDYERFLFNLLLDNPRCEHCLAPLQNNTDAIKDHINYYHFDIKI